MLNEIRLTKNRIGTENSVRRDSGIFRRMFEKAGKILANCGKWVLSGILLGGTIIVSQACSSGTPMYRFDASKEEMSDVWVEAKTSDSSAELLSPETNVKDIKEILDIPPKVETAETNITDSQEEDVTEIEGDGSNCYEIEIPAEGSKHNFLTYIGDFIDRTLLDREPHSSEQSAYSFETPEINEYANPFSNGVGGSLASVEDASEFLYRIDGNVFEPLANFGVEDQKSSNEYLEIQRIWINGVIYSPEYDVEPEAFLNSVTYSVKFANGGNEDGIPICTKINAGYNYTDCTDWSLKTENHRVVINFLDQLWVILKMTPPGDKGTDSEFEVVNGGSVKIGKELNRGILNKGEILVSKDGQLKVILNDISSEGSLEYPAIMTFLDANDQVIAEGVEVKVSPGSSTEVYLNNESYIIWVYETAPGYTVLTTWADIGILDYVMDLEDGQKIKDENSDWKVSLGWKNRKASSQDKQPDHLRTIILQKDVSDFFWMDGLQEGDWISILEEPGVWKLTYDGLNTSFGDKVTLDYFLEPNQDKILPKITYESGKIECLLKAPYVKVKTSEGKFCIEGHCDYEFFVAANASGYGVLCMDDNASDIHFGAGSIIIRNGILQEYYITEIGQNGGSPIDLQYTIAGAGVSWESGGVIRVATNLNDVIQDPGIDTTGWISDLAISLSENSMDEPGQMPVRTTVFLDSDELFPTFNFNGGALTQENMYVQTDHAYYESTGITTIEDGFPIWEGALTERGTEFTSVSNTDVELKVAKKVVKASFWLIEAESETTITMTVCDE